MPELVGKREALPNHRLGCVDEDERHSPLSSVSAGRSALRQLRQHHIDPGAALDALQYVWDWAVVADRQVTSSFARSRLWGHVPAHLLDNGLRTEVIADDTPEQVKRLRYFGAGLAGGAKPDAGSRPSISQEILNAYVKHPCQVHKLVHRDGTLALLNTAHGRRIDTYGSGELSLIETAALPELDDPGHKARLDIRLGRQDSSLSPPIVVIAS
jgi:hypothetical protein